VGDPTPSTRFAGDEALRGALVQELLAARLIGVFATHDESGAIHAVPMWFALVEDEIVLATSSGSRKVRNLEVDSRATLVVHDSRPGIEVCGVSLLGRADIVRGEDALPLVAAVHARYVDAARAAPEARVFLASDDVALRFSVDSAFSWDERGNVANAALRASGAALPLLGTEPRP